MKNVTITLPEEVARWARIWAASHSTSVSRFVGELLERRMTEELGYEQAMRQFLSRAPVELTRVGQYPRRDELHERSRIR